MLAAVTNAAGEPPALQDVELDEPRADEILVRLAACGICHTDLSMRELWPRIAGRFPVVFGHEGAGVVERVGEGVQRVRPGDAVVMSYRSCRACPECVAGRPFYCVRFAALNASGVRPDGSATMRANGRPVYGSFFGQSSLATHALAYEDNVVVVGGDVDLGVAAPFGCSVQTGAGTVMNVLELDERSSLVVFGAGGVGLPAVMAGAGARRRGDRRLSTRSRAAGGSPSRWARPPRWTRRSTTSSQRSATTRAAGATSAIETTAIAGVLLQALECLGARGTCVALGVAMPEFAFDMQRLARGKALRTAIEGDADPHELVPRLVELHARGELPVERLIRTYPFAEFGRALRDAESGAAIKPVLVF